MDVLVAKNFTVVFYVSSFMVVRGCGVLLVLLGALFVCLLEHGLVAVDTVHVNAGICSCCCCWVEHSC